MDTPKYSQLENERRFLVSAAEKLELADRHYVQIDDLYLANTRLRLRSVTSPEGDVVYKLCKKYPTADRYSGAMVNTYLTYSEYSVFNAIPGNRLSKRRYTVRAAGVSFGINVFDDPLNGLVLCEAEKPTRKEICSLRFPSWATKEVTEDDFFTGARLAQITSEQLQEKLAALNV